MKLRRPPKNIPVYSIEDARKYVRKSLNDNDTIELIVALCTLCLIPYYFVKHLVMSIYNLLRYCTYSLNDKEEQSVQRFIERKEKQ
jgi:hypothetical protein